tara:strand:- start:55804 stop:56502 length:699 start_codon:yes stop_codon:yes gene_type:complete
MFDPLLEELNASLISHGGQLIDLPSDISQKLSSKSNSKIESWLWTVPGFRRWRVTRLDAGKKLQVLNSVAYPSFNCDKPIMGIDLLWFGVKEKLVAVLDFQPLIQDEIYFEKYFQGLQSLKNKFPSFNKQTSMFSYDPNYYFSPWVLFCKGGIQDANISLPVVFSSFLKSYWELHGQHKNINTNLEPNDVKRLHINYDKYSAEKDPAHGLFSSFFGKEWSDKFLKEFLFPLS